MKMLLLSTIMCTMLAIACKKRDNGSLGGSWTEEGQPYTAQSVKGGVVNTNNYGLGATYKNGEETHSISFLFNGSLAPKAGIYKVVSTQPAAGEVSFSLGWGVLSSPHYWFYRSAGYDSVRATVTVSNDRISISMPDAYAIDYVDNDTIKVSANITQTE